MKYLIINAKKCINGKETWITFFPYSEFIKTDDVLGFNLLSTKRKRIRGDHLNELTMEWFSSPVQIYFKSVNGVKEISRIKLGDKEIISRS